MKVEPTRLAAAVAAIYGATTPRPMTRLRSVPCTACANRRRSMTMCPACGGARYFLVIA